MSFARGPGDAPPGVPTAPRTASSRRWISRGTISSPRSRIPRVSTSPAADVDRMGEDAFVYPSMPAPARSSDPKHAALEVRNDRATSANEPLDARDAVARILDDALRHDIDGGLPRPASTVWSIASTPTSLLLRSMPWHQLSGRVDRACGRTHGAKHQRSRYRYHRRAL